MLIDAAIRLLIVDHPRHDVQPILRPLRGASYLVRHWQADRLDDLQRLIDEQPLDLIVVRPGEGLPRVEDVRDSVDGAFKDIPIIAVIEHLESAVAARLLGAGADRIAALSIPTSLPMVARLELNRLEQRRQARRWEGLYRESEARAQALLEGARDAVAYIHEGAHVYANPAYRELFGYGDNMVGCTLVDLIDRADRDTLKAYLRQADQAHHDTTGKTPAAEWVELRAHRADGGNIDIRLCATPSRMNEEPCLQLLVRRSDEDSELHSRLQYVAEHDPVTGFYNRHSFTERLTRLRTHALTSGQSGGAVLYVLLTDYRNIAQSLGLEAVDALLRAVAEAVLRQLGPDDLVARFADATFTVYTPATGRAAALELGERLCRSIGERSVAVESRLISTRACAGVCLLGDASHSPTQIVAFADRACEQARQLGPGQVQVYAPINPDRDSAARRDALLRELRAAMIERRLEAHYEPVASLAGDARQRYRVRLFAPDAAGAPLDLDELVPLAEARGVMRQIDRWLIATALRTAAGAGGKHGELVLFLGLSSNSITDAEFPAWLGQHLAEVQVPGRTLVLEIAEESVEPYLVDLLRLRKQLAPLDCALALHHCGRHGDSQRYLEHLRPSYVELDMDSVDRAGSDADLRRDLEGLVRSAHALGAQVIAVDVTSPSRLANAWGFGIDHVQGPVVQAASPRLDFDFQQFVL